VGANVELATAQAREIALPLVDISIPHEGDVLKIVVRNPQAVAGHQIQMPDDPWARVADRAMGVIGTIGGIWAGGEAAIGLVGAVGGVVGTALQSMPDAVVVTQPAPVVVDPQAPVVVTQPAPIVVTQPPPLVVETPPPTIVYPHPAQVVDPVIVQGAPQ
jgi:hypothetical protein